MKNTGLTTGSRTSSDACCGYGRHSIELAKRGYDVVGIDRFESYLHEARKRAASEGVEVQFIPMDVRELSFEREFDLIINMWNSFGFFDDETNSSILKRFNDCLAEDGKLLLDLINRDWWIKNFARRDWWRVDENLMVLEERSFDLATSVNHCTWHFLENGQLTETTVNMRVYSCHELIALLRDCGFNHVEAFGGLEGGPVTFDSQAMQLVATKS